MPRMNVSVPGIPQPLAFYTPPSEIAEATNSFSDTRDIMAFFEEEIGVPYPWAKYDQVCVNDFVEGGMENTSLTTLNDSTLHTEEFENLRESQGLTLAEVAERMGIDAPALSRLETGKMLNPTLATLHKWAEALGQKLDVDLLPK